MFATLSKIVLLLFTFVLLQDFVVALRRELPTCRSRDTCIRLTHCAPYMNLIRSLKKPLSRAAVLFLRKQECGFDGMYPMVCCFPSNTRRGQGNRLNPSDDEGYTTKTPTYYVPSFHDTHHNPKEDTEETYQAPSKPDLTPSDLSDYRYFKGQSTKFQPAPEQVSKLPEEKRVLVETSSLKSKSTTDRVETTTKLFRKKANGVLGSEYDDIVPPGKLNQSKEVRNKKAEELRRKMEAINNAFMYSTMDYFFVRRMDDEKNRNN